LNSASAYYAVSVVVLIFITSFGASLLASLSGGSASAITIPLFITYGLSYPQAIATQLFTGAFYTLAAAWNYLRGEQAQYRFLALFTVVGLLGVYGGVRTVSSIDEHFLKLGAGLLLLLVVILMAISPTLGVVRKTHNSALRRRVAYLFAPILGFYEGIFGAGNTILTSLVTLETRGFTLSEALGHYYVISFVWCAFGGLFLFDRGYFDLLIVAPALLGSIAGGYIGSAYSRRKGNRFLKYLFIGMGVILALKLLFFS
jgi:uncharacterized protein